MEAHGTIERFCLSTDFLLQVLLNHEYNHNQCLDTIHSEYLFSNKQDIDENEAVLFIRAHML